MTKKTLKKMPPLLKYTGLSVGILALATLITWAYSARQTPVPVDSSAIILDELMAIANGANVLLVHPTAPEKGMVFFITDNSAAEVTTDYAKKFAALSYYVVVLDTKDLLRPTGTSATQCLDISERLLDIQNSLSQKLDLDAATLPILVGINEGAAVVYSALAQDEAHRFHAAISINFSGQLHSDTNFCAADKFVRSTADGATDLSPVERLSSRWYLFQDSTKTPSIDIREFADQIVNAKFTTSLDTDEPIIADVLQVLQWLDPRLIDQLSSDNAEGDLPLMEVTSAIDNPSQTMAIMITGDGGWAEIDKGIAAILAEKGIPTVALDSLSYFWKKRTPDEVAQDIENTMINYLEKWDKKQVILIGYSFGADVMPFVANRIHPENRKDIALVAMLGIGKSAAFEFHLSSWMDVNQSTDRLPLVPEVRKMDWAKSICIYGDTDEDADCAALSGLGVKVISMNGGHHFDEKYNELVQHILDNINPN